MDKEPLNVKAVKIAEMHSKHREELIKSLEASKLSAEEKKAHLEVIELSKRLDDYDETRQRMRRNEVYLIINLIVSTVSTAITIMFLIRKG
jgi:hypothetical protein